MGVWDDVAKVDERQVHQSPVVLMYCLCYCCCCLRHLIVVGSIVVGMIVGGVIVFVAVVLRLSGDVFDDKN